MARTSSKYLMNQKELEVLMNKGCKGFVTELTKVAARKLYENTDKAFGPGHWYLKKRALGQAQKPYESRGGAFKSAITFDARTENIEDAFTNMVYFAPYEIADLAVSKTHEYLGGYVDVRNDNVDAGDFIEWMEKGTYYNNGGKMEKFKRKGAGFIEETINDIDRFLAGSGVDALIESEFDYASGLRITRMK